MDHYLIFVVRKMLFIVQLFGWGIWNTKGQTRVSLEAFEMEIWRYVLGVSWTQRITNEERLRRLGIQRRLITIIHKRQLRFAGHIERKDGLESLYMSGMMNGRKGRDHPRKCYTDSLIEITGSSHSLVELRRMMKERSLWRSMLPHVRLDLTQFISQDLSQT